MFNKTKLIILTLTIFLESCRSFPCYGIYRKGTKTKCLALFTDKLSIDCNCIDKQIAKITIYKKDTKESFGVKTFDVLFEPTVNSFSLPIAKDTADKCILLFEIYLTNSHSAEKYLIQTMPSDFSKIKKIYSVYFSD